MNNLDKLGQKYALNINRIGVPAKKNKFSFQDLNIGFYDDIEKDDNFLKKSNKKLQKLKNISLKEFIYTNKEIPHSWKKKVNYKNDLLNMITKDDNVLLYI